MASETAPSLDVLAREYDGSVHVIRTMIQLLERDHPVFTASAVRLGKTYLEGVKK